MSVAIRSGELRHLVTIQSSTLTQDGYGEPTTGDFAPVCDVHAKIEPLRGREAFEARQVVADVTHKVTMRYFPGLNSKMQLAHGDRTLRIQQIVNPEERNVVHELLCVERT
jgi:SPP1 family predicted phage head-tail adaptor